MTDRELLEQAAKAAGIVGEHVSENRMIREFCFKRYEYIRTQSGGWNPLTDDGDSLRLAVKLGIHLQFAMDFAVSYAGSVHAKQFTERDGDDPCAATRRAIVRAAAEIGKGMVAQPSGKDLPEDDYYKSQAEAFYGGKL